MLTRLKPLRVEIAFLLLTLLPALVVAFANPNTILDWYSSDDGFYYFQVARNLAAGQGFTFDGLNPTNGFHPLWLFMIMPLFLFAPLSPLLPLRLLLIVSALLSAGCAILLYRILRRYVAEGVAALVGLIWIVSPRLHDLTWHSGVEAGVNAFCLLLFWHALVAYEPGRIRRQALRGLAQLGLLATLAILARLDNVFVVFFGGAWLWLRLWAPPKPAKRGQDAWRWRFSTGLAFFGPIVVIMLAYLAWNKLGFDTFSPISGQVKVWWGTLRNTVYGFPVRHAAAFFGQFVTNDPELGPWSLLTAPLYAAAEGLLRLLGQAGEAARRIALLGFGALLVTALGLLVRRHRTAVARAVRELGLLPFFGCFLQICYYKLTGSVAQQPWYWIGEMILILLGFGLLLHLVWLSLPLGTAKRRAKRGETLAAVAFAALSLVFLVYIASAFRAPGDGSNHFYLDRARWLESHTQPGARVAITGAGNLAYFIKDRTIVNMDGLMNTRAYLDALKAERGAAYLASFRVDYVFGNEYILTETNPYAPMLAGHLQPYQVYTFADRELPLWRFVP